jgi:hypothetical protein
MQPEEDLSELMPDLPLQLYADHGDKVQEEET